MIKKIKIGILFVFLFIFATGCNILPGGDKEDDTDFKKGDSGLIMEFVKNFPGDRYLISGAEGSKEIISIIIDVRNVGTFSDGNNLGGGNIYLGGFDDEIIKLETKSKSLADENVFLPAASPVNPLGGFDTVEFDGFIVAEKITIDEYTPTILATACYPYITKASPTVCIDPLPFDDRQERVCQIGSQTLSSQGAPVAVTKIEQEASTNKIQFKIHIKNIGGGDVLKSGKGVYDIDTLKKCSLTGKSDGKVRLLDRKDFDRVKVESIKVGSFDFLKDVDGKFRNPKLCSPFADGSNDIIRLFNGEGFVICTLTVSDLGDVRSAYTTPLNVELGYNYRSTISKQINIRKLEESSLPGTSGEKPSSALGDPTTCAAPALMENSCLEEGSDSIKFQWNEVEGAEDYTVKWCYQLIDELDTPYDVCDDEPRVENTPGTVNYEATGLLPDTNYEFSVWVQKSDETICTSQSTRSEFRTCRTKAVEVVSAQPSVPATTEPSTVDSDLRCAAPSISNDFSNRCRSVTETEIIFKWDGVYGADIYNVSWCPGVKGENFEVGDPNCDSDITVGLHKIVSGLTPNTNYNFKVYVSKSSEDVCETEGHESNIGSCLTQPLDTLN